jgi:hypothetical protein
LTVLIFGSFIDSVLIARMNWLFDCFKLKSMNWWAFSSIYSENKNPPVFASRYIKFLSETETTYFWACSSSLL